MTIDTVRDADTGWNWYKAKAWLSAFMALFIVAIYTTPAGATPQQLRVSIQQTTPNPALAGAAVSYSVTVQNTGITPQGNVQVKVRFPGSIWGLPANGVGAGCTFAGGGGAPTALVTCTAGAIAQLASRTFAVQILAPSKVSGNNSEQFTIVSELDVNGTAAGTGGADATAAVVTTVVAAADLDPQWSGPLTVNAGTEQPYTMTLRNIGSGHAPNVFVRISLPQEVDFVRIEQNTFQSCLPTGREIGCSIPTGIPPGGQASVRVVVRPLSLLADKSQFLLSVGADPFNTVRESHENNNTAFLITTVRAQADFDYGEVRIS